MFCSVVQALLQCKKTDILELNRTLVVVEPEPNPGSHRTRTLFSDTVKPVFFACPLFREFREPDKFAKITGTRKFGNDY